MTPNAPPVVELRGLTKQFGSMLANSGVNLWVEAGTIHGVIGENGAGKSTANPLDGLPHALACNNRLCGKGALWFARI